MSHLGIDFTGAARVPSCWSGTPTVTTRQETEALLRRYGPIVHRRLQAARRQHVAAASLEEVFVQSLTARGFSRSPDPCAVLYAASPGASPNRAAGCPSDLDLDRYLTANVDAYDWAYIDEHVAGCVDCRRHLDLTAAEFAALGASIETIAAQIHARAANHPGAAGGPRWQLGPGVLAAAVAAGLCCLVIAAADPSPAHSMVVEVGTDGAVHALLRAEPSRRLAHASPVSRYLVTCASPFSSSSLSFDGERLRAPGGCQVVAPAAAGFTR